MEGFPRRFGGYVLVKPLARGGMGALYLALHGQRGMEKLWIIKTALPHLIEKGYLQRFKDEAKVVVRLSHGNLVGVFDAGQVKGEIYLGMEFVEGKDLRAVQIVVPRRAWPFPSRWRSTSSRSWRVAWATPTPSKGCASFTGTFRPRTCSCPIPAR